MKKDIIKIYTDGSCTYSSHTQKTIGAWVAIVFMNKEKIVLKQVVQNTTHNRMELSAVIQALEFIKAKSIGVQNLTLYSDSQYVVQIKERKGKLKASNYLTKKGTPIQNADLVRRLIQQIETYPIDFIKVKAHQHKESVQNYNREADMLSRKLVRRCIELVKNAE